MIYLVRHGESDWNAEGIRHGLDDRPLTARGAQQAWQAGSDLDVHQPLTILTSPLKRAVHTAQIIAMALDYPFLPAVDARLIERKYDQGWQETCDEAASRAREAFDDLKGDVIAVTHAGVIKGLLRLAVTPLNGSIHRW